MKGSIVIRISHKNAKKLEALGKFGDKWDDLITKIFSELETKNKGVDKK